MGYDTKQLNATYKYIRSRDPWHLTFAAITSSARAWSYKYFYDIAMIESCKCTSNHSWINQAPESLSERLCVIPDSGVNPAGTGQTTQILSSYPLDFEPSMVCPDGHGIAEGTLSGLF